MAKTAEIININRTVADFDSPTAMRAAHVGDPMLAICITLMDESDLTDTQIANRSGVSKNTLKNWRSGRTKCPLRITMLFVMRALGYKMGVQNIRTGRLERRFDNLL